MPRFHLSIFKDYGPWFNWDQPVNRSLQNAKNSITCVLLETNIQRGFTWIFHRFVNQRLTHGTNRSITLLPTFRRNNQAYFRMFQTFCGPLWDERLGFKTEWNHLDLPWPHGHVDHPRGAFCNFLAVWAVPNWELIEAHWAQCKSTWSSLKRIGQVCLFKT